MKSRLCRRIRVHFGGKKWEEIGFQQWFLRVLYCDFWYGENDEKQNSMVRVGGDCSIYWSNQTIAGELSQKCQGRIA